MFESDHRSMKQSLLEMARSAHNAVLGQGIAPDAKLADYIRGDARFQGFASDRLAKVVLERARNGKSQTIDLDDPYLKGGEQRPLTNRTGGY
jgi:hypothetical protein